MNAAVIAGDSATTIATAATIQLRGGNDVVIVPGYVGLTDEPNEVVVRFSETLPDDNYRLEVLGVGSRALINVLGESFNDGRDQAVDFELDLAPLVVSVVPQPVARNKLSISLAGVTGGTFTLSFAELLQLDRVDQVTDFHCVEQWSVLDVPWSGVHLSTLFEQARPLDTATHVTFHCFGDIYRESLPLAEALEPRTILAYGIDCATMPLEHGFPLRLVIPRKWGYKNAKYVHRVELADEPVYGPWVRMGNTYEGDVSAAKLREGKY